MKMKLLTFVLLVLSAVGMAQAAEVINVDIKGYGDDTPYVGNGAYDVGEVVWTAYDGGWGKAVGSARTEGLATKDPNQGYYPSVYAAQLWLGDTGELHYYNWGSTLMDDGFLADEGEEPNLAIFGQNAFQGIYDIYVYGRDAGDFNLVCYGVSTVKSVTGGVAAGEFVENENYVVFSDVDLNDSYSGSIYLGYTNKLNALQFVKKKDPCSVQNGTRIKAGNYDVAGERNTDGAANPPLFGPDIYSDGNPTDTNIPYDPNRYVGYVEPLEFMGYDITLDDVNQGVYDIAVEVNTAGTYPVPLLRIYLDDRSIGTVKYNKVNPQSGDTNAVTVDLIKGNHTVKWQFPTGYDWGFNIVALKFKRLGVVDMNTCADVRTYGLLFPGDLTATDVNATPNCTENIYDLSVALDNWLKCNNPNPDACP